jgi:hypothetical protein
VVRLCDLAWLVVSVWREPARDLPVVGSPDVLVVGAGSAGIAAAVASARLGADTWLIERYGFVGGLATFGLINLLLTLDDGEGKQVVAGLCQHFVDALDERGAARYPHAEEWGSPDPASIERWRRYGLIWGAPPDVVRYSVAFDPEEFVTVAYENLTTAGVRLRLHSWCAAAPTVEGRIDAVIVESKAGRQVLRPRVVVDATGDGDVFVAAGAPYEAVSVSPYLWFRLGGIDDSAVGAAPPGLAFRTTAPGRALVAWGGPGAVEGKIDPVDPDALTFAELACRAGALAELDRLRAEVPGFADAWLDDVAKLLGITESRRLVGDFLLEKEHGNTRFADSIAQTGHWTRRGVVFDVPYRCLTTPVVANLLVAGRCISVSRYVHQATKEIPAAMATGEAAGTAAARALDVGGEVHIVDVEEVRRDLRAFGAIVGGES